MADMIAAVAPQKRGIVPPAHVKAIAAAKARRDTAEEAYKQAIADALKAGGSVRELERLTGLAMQTISDWGHARGWPTAEQQAHRDVMYHRKDADPKRSGG